MDIGASDTSPVKVIVHHRSDAPGALYSGALYSGRISLVEGLVIVVGAVDAVEKLPSGLFATQVPLWLTCG